MCKPVVHYKQGSLLFMGECNPCILQPVDHPSGYAVTNKKPALTSLVLSYDAVTGQIETENTVYLPEIKCTCTGGFMVEHNVTCATRHRGEGA